MITKVETKFFDILYKHKIPLILVTITIISLIIRFMLYENAYGDYDMFLEPWFRELKAGGGLRALALNIGNYNAPYMTILALLTYLPIEPLISIKTVSVIFDYICAIMVFYITSLVLKDAKNKTAIATLFYSIVVLLPTVFLNSAYWAQCDSIYVAFALISISYLIRKRYFPAFVFLGISLAFKLQCLFLLPLYILIYLSERKFSITYFLLSLLSFLGMCVPSFINGNTIQNVFEVYFGQSGTYSSYITLNFPNLYSIFWGSGSDHLVVTPNELLPKIGFGVTFAFFAIIAFLVFYKKVKFDSRAIVEFGLWSILICTFLLPSMHERYMYMADILSIVYLIFNRKKFFVPLAIQFVSLYGYFHFLFYGVQMEMRIMGGVNLLLFIYYSQDMFKRYFSTPEVEES